MLQKEDKAYGQMFKELERKEYTEVLGEEPTGLLQVLEVRNV